MVALGTKGHFPTADACGGPCGVSGCLNWFFSPLWLFAATVLTVPVQNFTPHCCQAIQEQFGRTQTVFLGRKERAALAVKVEQALGFQGGFCSLGTL